MSSYISSDILILNHNQGSDSILILDITDLIDKVFIKSSLTKELKDKATLEVFQTFLNKINEQINNSNYESLSDLILNKSQYLKNTADKLDWVNPENLKVNNPQRLALIIYNYLRFKFSFNIKS